MTRFGNIASVLAVTTLLACSEDATQLLVVVDSDMKVPKPLSMVRAEIREESGSLLGSHEFSLVNAPQPAGVAQFNLPFSFGVLAPADDDEARIIVEVSAVETASASKPLFTRRAVTGFLDNKTLLLPMFLASRCRTLTCGPGQTCTENGCVSEAVDETRLKESIGAPGDLVLVTPPPEDSGVMDAEIATDAQVQLDAMPPDTGVIQDSGARDSGAPPACNDDRFENNDDLAQASSLAIGTSVDLRVCPGDEDFYDVSLSRGDTLRVELNFSHAEGDVNVELLDSSGGVVASSLSPSDNELILYTSPFTGRFYLKVFLQTDLGSTPGNSYRLTPSVTTMPCPADVYEPNNAREEAVMLVPDTYPNLQICPNDNDYYRVVINSGDEFTITASFIHAEGDIDLRLLNVIGFPVGGSNSSTDNESASYTATRVGTLIIEVSLHADSGTVPGNVYTLEINRQ